MDIIQFLIDNFGAVFCIVLAAVVFGAILGWAVDLGDQHWGDR